MKNKANTHIIVVAVGLLFRGLETPVDAETISGGSQPVGSHDRSHSQLLIPVTLADGGLLLGVGLYDGDSAEVIKGDLNSQDYWWTKFDAMMLEIALKQHQPEGRIGVDVAIALRRIADLAKKYPKHEGIQKWKVRFEEIQTKINPDADRRPNFGPECPWDEANFAQLWVNVHWIKLLVDQKDWTDAAPLVQNIKQNYKIMLAPDRMKDYPEDLRKWVTSSKPEADELAATVKTKTGG